MAWALECDGVNDYLSTNVSNDDDVLRISAKIKFDAGTIGGDNRLVAFDPSGACFIGFGVYQGKLRIYSRDINSNAVAVLSSNRVDTGEFIDVYWELNKVSGMVTVSENGTKSSATNANSTSYPSMLTSSTLMSQSAASGRLKAQVSTISMIDTTTSSNSFFLDATASDHSNTGAQPVLVDTIGNNNATGVNFPTDGSAWVDLGGNLPLIELIFDDSTVNPSSEQLSIKNIAIIDLSNTETKVTSDKAVIISMTQLSFFDSTTNITSDSALLANILQLQLLNSSIQLSSDGLVLRYISALSFSGTTTQPTTDTVNIENSGLLFFSGSIIQPASDTLAIELYTDLEFTGSLVQIQSQALHITTQVMPSFGNNDLILIDNTISYFLTDNTNDYRIK